MLGTANATTAIDAYRVFIVISFARAIGCMPCGGLVGRRAACSRFKVISKAGPSSNSNHVQRALGDGGHEQDSAM